MEDKLFRLDLRTLDETEIPESIDIPYSAWTNICGDELVHHESSWPSKIVALNLATLKETKLMEARDLYDATTEYVLTPVGNESKLLNRRDGKILHLEKEYQKISGHRLYTIRKSYNYVYDLTTGKERQLREFSWNFEPCKECGDYLYGIIRGVCDERELFAYNQSTKKITSLLTYYDAGLMESGDVYQNDWILIDRESLDEPITVYAVDLKTAEVHKLAHFEESKGITILGIIGSAFYYTIYDEVDDEDEYEDDDEDENEESEDRGKDEEVNPYHLFKIDLHSLGEAVEVI